MFLSKPGEFKPCGTFSTGHLLLLVATCLAIFIAVKNTKITEKADIKKIIKKCTIVIWVLEILKIIYNISIGKGGEFNKIMPLYYCSLLLYAGLLSSFAKGKLQRMGDVFLATGAIVGGVVFLIMPTTSLPEYPVFHFISVHSFLFHGIMIYLGIIVNKFNYIELNLIDIKYYSLLIGIICVCAYIVNEKYGSNLMFISRDFPGTPISKVYHITGKFFTPLACISQMTMPFLGVYSIIEIKKKITKKG